MTFFQLVQFALIAAARSERDYSAGFAERYQSFGLVAFIIIVAAICDVLLRHRRRAAQVLGLVLVAGLGLMIIHDIPHNLRLKPARAIRRGTVIRQDYYRLKQDLLVAGKTYPNIYLTHHAHPDLRAHELSAVIAYLDPRVRPWLPREFTPVIYYEQPANTRPWGHLIDRQWAVQSLRFPAPGRVEQIELLMATGDKPDVDDCALALLGPAGEVLHETRIPGHRILNNFWLPCRMPSVPVEAGSQYGVRIRSFATRPDRACTVWMNTNEDSWPDGETLAPDGTHGDLCFRIAVSPRQ